MNMQIEQHLPDLSLNYIEQGISNQKKRGAVTFFNHTELSGCILLAVKIGAVCAPWNRSCLWGCWGAGAQNQWQGGQFSSVDCIHSDHPCPLSLRWTPTWRWFKTQNNNNNNNDNNRFSLCFPFLEFVLSQRYNNTCMLVYYSKGLKWPSRTLFSKLSGV